MDATDTSSSGDDRPAPGLAVTRSAPTRVRLPRPLSLLLPSTGAREPSSAPATSALVLPQERPAAQLTGSSEGAGASSGPPAGTVQPVRGSVLRLPIDTAVLPLASRSASPTITSGMPATARRLVASPAATASVLTMGPGISYWNSVCGGSFTLAPHGGLPTPPPPQQEYFKALQQQQAENAVAARIGSALALEREHVHIVWFSQHRLSPLSAHTLRFYRCFAPLLQLADSTFPKLGAPEQGAIANYISMSVPYIMRSRGSTSLIFFASKERVSAARDSMAASSRRPLARNRAHQRIDRAWDTLCLYSRVQHVRNE